MESATKGVSTATVSAVIVRACENCGGKRELNTSCADCGNTNPPKVHNLGVQSAYYKNPLKRALWFSIGQFLAKARAQKANQEIRNGHSS